MRYGETDKYSAGRTSLRERSHRITAQTSQQYQSRKYSTMFCVCLLKQVTDKVYPGHLMLEIYVPNITHPHPNVFTVVLLILLPDKSHKQKRECLKNLGKQ